MTKKCTIIYIYFWSLRSIFKINILNCIVYIARKMTCHQNPGPGYNNEEV